MSDLNNELAKTLFKRCIKEGYTIHIDSLSVVADDKNRIVHLTPKDTPTAGDSNDREESEKLVIFGWIVTVLGLPDAGNPDKYNELTDKLYALIEAAERAARIDEHEQRLLNIGLSAYDRKLSHDRIAALRKGEKG